MKYLLRLLALGIVALVFSACASSNAGNAPQAIEAYIKALVAQNKDAAVAAACAKYEANAKLEVDSFAGLAPTLDNVTCTESGADGDSKLVTCKGVIKMTYNNEQQQLPLDGRNYIAVQENGDWRMCGYK